MNLINTYMQKVVIYPGRFQPMLAHHAEVYKKLQAQFPDAKVYVGTSNKVDGEKSPFNFEEKQLIATAHGIPAEAVLPGKLPYHKDSYPQFDEKNTMIIFAVGEKDLGRFPFDNVDSESGLQMTKRGEPRPAYYQKIDTMAKDPVPMEHRGYITIAPTIQIGDEVASASAFRDRIKNAPNEEEAKKYFVNQFGEYNEKVFNLIYTKIVRNKMSEELNIMRQLAGLSEAPVNFDDYQTISPKDAKQAAQRPELRANADPEAAKFLPPDPKMFHSTIKKSVANRMGVEDVNDPSVKKEHFMRELLKSPAVLLGEINARLANDDNGLAVSDRLSEIIEELDGGLGGLSAEDKQFVIKITANAIKNMELIKDPKADQERDEYEKENESVDLSDIRNDYGIEEQVISERELRDIKIDSTEHEIVVKVGDDKSYTLFIDGKKVGEYSSFGQAKKVVSKKLKNESVDLSNIKSDYGIEEEAVEEGKMKDIIMDLKDMSKEEFCSAHPQHADEYEELCKQYGDDAQSEPEESFDPAMEPSHYDSQFERIYAAYENGGEPEMAEYLGMSDSELDQEMSEYAMDHNLHMDDDRDDVIQGYIEQCLDNRDHDNHQEAVEVEETKCEQCGMEDCPCEPGECDCPPVEEAIEDSASKAIDAAMSELRQLAGL